MDKKHARSAFKLNNHFFSEGTTLSNRMVQTNARGFCFTEAVIFVFNAPTVSKLPRQVISFSLPKKKKKFFLTLLLPYAPSFSSHHESFFFFVPQKRIFLIKYDSLSHQYIVVKESINPLYQIIF